jgi:TctA family transporter
LVLSSGDHNTFIEDPISLGLLAFSLVFIVGSLVRHALDLRKQERQGLAT